ncbi:beta-carotene 15,15'-dioxygenase-domain-containing protein [Cladochytrium replicatum]|nr:beta-carotene 15,15'-dioxygenase-domain-containing protein [Cladochytrium replicatum]
MGRTTIQTQIPVHKIFGDSFKGNDPDAFPHKGLLESSLNSPSSVQVNRNVSPKPTHPTRSIDQPCPLYHSTSLSSDIAPNTVSDDMSTLAHHRNATVLTTIIIIFVSYALTDRADFARYVGAPILALGTIVFGMPHGAVDHLLFYKQFGKISVQFYQSYLGVMVAYVALWVISAELGFGAFLLGSLYHFGEGEISYLRPLYRVRHRNHLPILLLTRGLLILGAIVSSDPSISYPIVQAVLRQTPQSPILTLFSQDAAPYVRLLTQLPHLLTLPLIAPPRVVAFESLRSLVLAWLFTALGPIWGFGVFWNLWHSAGAFFVEAAYLLKSPSHSETETNGWGEGTESVSWKECYSLYNLAMPYTSVAFTGMAIFYFLLRYGDTAGSGAALGYEDVMKSQGGQSLASWLITDGDLWTAFVVVISVLTAPHMWVFHLLSDQNKG